MDILGKLFGSADRIKVMRLLLLNPEEMFKSREVARRAKISLSASRRELSLLSRVGFLKSKRGAGSKLNQNFPFLNQLRGLFQVDLLTRQKEITDRFANCGKIKLLIASGLFLQNNDSRADLLIVGDGLKRLSIDRAIKSIEAEVGRELVYASLDTEDFLYRINAYDKFVRDILDYPHEKIIDRLGLDGTYPQEFEKALD